MVIPTKLRPLHVDHIQLTSRSSVIVDSYDPMKSHTSNIPPNPVKQSEHPIYLESSYESILPSTTLEPTESLTSIVKTNQRKQDYSTTSNTEMIQKSQIIKYSVTSTTANTESSIIATRVDSSITKVTSTLLPMPDDKTHLKINDSNVQITRNITKPTVNAAAKNESSTMRMKPKEV